MPQDNNTSTFTWNRRSKSATKDKCKHGHTQEGGF